MRVSIFSLVLIAIATAVAATSLSPYENYVTYKMEYNQAPSITYIRDIDFRIVNVAGPSQIKYIYNHWFYNGKIMNRETGAAITFHDGTQYYIVNGLLREIRKLNTTVFYINYEMWTLDYIQVNLRSDTTHDTFYNQI
jgi:hypothetical protein